MRSRWLLFLFAREKLRNPLQPFHGFGLQRVLKKNLRLHHQIVQRTRAGLLLGSRRRTALSGRRLRLGGVRAQLAQASPHTGKKSGIGLSFDLAETLLVAGIVGVDIHQLLKCLGSPPHIVRGGIQIEEPNQGVEIFRFAVQLAVHARPEFGERKRPGVGVRQSVEPTSEVVVPAPGAHLFSQSLQ